VSAESAVVRLFEIVDSRLGRPTIPVNKAATLESQMCLVSMDAARIQRVFATNIIGSLICAREAFRRMSLKHGGAGGNIVNLLSVAARPGSAREYIDYAASLAANLDLGISGRNSSCATGLFSEHPKSIELLLAARFPS
jgi:NAD(P)-dependent dehydrogenase (short-subunit alcohol dehydrogenase family)